MRATRFVLALAAACVAIMALVTGAGSALAHGSSHNSVNSQLAKVRAATARYHSLDVAKQHQYALLTDAAGIACIANPPVGTMGVHFVNGDLVAAANAGTLDPTRPQALVYEPEEHGQMRLVAVEYVVFQQQWDATHKAAPKLFGQQFMLTPDGNRFGLPAFYSLHAWIWNVNPDGMFAMWNPRVDCH